MDSTDKVTGRKGNEMRATETHLVDGTLSASESERTDMKSQGRNKAGRLPDWAKRSEVI